MMGSVIIVGILVVLAVVYLFLRAGGSSGAAGDAGKAMPPEQALRYRPANGQDVAPLIAALRTAGYDAAPDTAEGEPRVLISAPAGGEVDRERVRTVLEDANRSSVVDGVDVDAPVRFEGEQKPPV